MTHAPPVTVANEALTAAIRDDLTTYASALDQPPTAVQTIDLWAHARDIRGDGLAAARWTRKVLDLGWRPVDFAPSETTEETP